MAISSTPKHLIIELLLLYKNNFMGCATLSN